MSLFMKITANCNICPGSTYFVDPGTTFITISLPHKPNPTHKKSLESEGGQGGQD